MGLILFAGSTLLLAFDDALVPVGFCLMLPVACSNIVIQSLVPEALREREIISVLDDRRGCGAAEGAVGGSNRQGLGSLVMMSWGTITYGGVFSFQ
jgi:hypothetical protein